ncbi:hypothetical protein E2C01_098052 [Portunus trituberculatus]|uniref:Uncharacterized protein n=1 Tax=Portunus trituberculatus TaxID=210409 RepID=A0A5B7K7D4_PORTR|nr:hypothetical protein [Portunus trituberculatus]
MRESTPNKTSQASQGDTRSLPGDYSLRLTAKHMTGSCNGPGMKCCLVDGGTANKVNPDRTLTYPSFFLPCEEGATKTKEDPRKILYRHPSYLPHGMEGQPNLKKIPTEPSLTLLSSMSCEEVTTKTKEKPGKILLPTPFFLDARDEGIARLQEAQTEPLTYPSFFLVL